MHFSMTKQPASWLITDWCAKLKTNICVDSKKVGCVRQRGQENLAAAPGGARLSEGQVRTSEHADEDQPTDERHTRCTGARVWFQDTRSNKVGLLCKALHGARDASQIRPS